MLTVGPWWCFEHLAYTFRKWENEILDFTMKLKKKISLNVSLLRRREYLKILLITRIGFRKG